jgi:N-acetylglucosaminyldiphosphoundecaprenol N-acetyl-beta-D-mannosaminyltransferase
LAEPVTFDVLGVQVNGASFRDVLERVIRAPDEGERLSMHFATAHTIVAAHEDAPLRRALADGIVEPDGMPLVWLGRRQGLTVERVCGPDLMPAVIERGVELGRRHFFYGGAAGVPETLAERLTRRFPGLVTVGTLSPPFRPLRPDEDEAIAALINSAAPDYVWVGLGAPKQDLWVAAHRPRLHAPVLLAVGAAFDLFAGRRQRAPVIMQRTGTEWVYRLATEPRRLGSRYTLTNAKFLALLARHHIGHLMRRFVR